MTSIVYKKQPNVSTEPEKKAEEQQEDMETTTIPEFVVTHLYLKPAHATGTLDKEVVLRSIRHRKRINNVKKAVKALLNSPSASNNDKVSVPRLKWVDDAFAAP